ncbi:unnamed protein product [Musa acuminata var. zebrina]
MAARWGAGKPSPPRLDSRLTTIATLLTYSNLFHHPTTFFSIYIRIHLSANRKACPPLATMTLAFLPEALRAVLLVQRPLLLYAAAWAAFLTATVAVTSFAPELAFVWAVMPSSSFSSACTAAAGGPAVRVPTDGPPREVVCVPAGLFARSRMDLVVPPLFAALVVGGSTCFIRAVGLWEPEEEAIA